MTKKRHIRCIFDGYPIDVGAWGHVLDVPVHFKVESLDERRKLPLTKTGKLALLDELTGQPGVFAGFARTSADMAAELRARSSSTDDRECCWQRYSSSAFHGC